MFDKNFLKKISIIYVEDDKNIRDSFLESLEKYFKKIYPAVDGQEAIHLYEHLKKKNVKINAIISDINMPNMCGLELLEYIRKDNASLPFIFTTAHSDSEYLLKAIKLQTTDYILKPMDIMSLLEKINKFCNDEEKSKLMKTQKKELERYLIAIDNVAIISKTDTKGRITFANQIFCDIAQYKKEEIYGKSHSIVRHPDMPSAAFKDLWETVKSGNTWQGKVKNKAKDGSAYYVNATIIPLFDKSGENIIEYMGIRFLTTEEELEKREFKKKVLQNIKESKQKESEHQSKIRELEIQISSYKEYDRLVEILEKEKVRADKLYSQLTHYEDELKQMKLKKEKLITFANEKVKKNSVLALELRNRNNKLLMKNTFLEEKIEKKKNTIIALQERNQEQSKVIINLKDVISHREKELDSYKI